MVSLTVGLITFNSPKTPWEVAGPYLFISLESSLTESELKGLIFKQTEVTFSHSHNRRCDSTLSATSEPPVLICTANMELKNIHCRRAGYSNLQLVRGSLCRDCMFFLCLYGFPQTGLWGQVVTLNFPHRDESGFICISLPLCQGWAVRAYPAFSPMLSDTGFTNYDPHLDRTDIQDRFTWIYVSTALWVRMLLSRAKSDRNTCWCAENCREILFYLYFPVDLFSNCFVFTFISNTLFIHPFMYAFFYMFFSPSDICNIVTW